jgi:type IX secretion system PorP/SprF family membrane protein
MNTKVNLSCVFFLYLLLVRGQEEPFLFLFPDQILWINPAHLSAEKPKLRLQINSQWLGTKDAPKEQFISFHTRAKNQNLFLGGGVRNQTEFAESKTELRVQFAYNLTLSEKSNLTLGLHSGGYLYNLSFAYLQSVEGIDQDPLLLQEGVFYPKIGVGFHIKKSNFEIEMAFPQLITHQNSKVKSRFYFESKFLFFTSLAYTFNRLNSNQSLKWTAQFHNFNYKNHTLELLATYNFSQLALFFKWNTLSYGAMGFTLYEKKMLTVGYGFHFPLKSIPEIKRNHHSLILNFRLQTKSNQP